MLSHMGTCWGASPRDVPVLSFIDLFVHPVLPVEIVELSFTFLFAFEPADQESQSKWSHWCNFFLAANVSRSVNKSSFDRKRELTAEVVSDRAESLVVCTVTYTYAVS